MATNEQVNRNEIGYKVLKAMLKEQGFEIDKNFRRIVGNMAKKTGVDFGELLQFYKELGVELMDEVAELGKPAAPEELEEDHHGHGFGFHGGHGGH